jgi:hypothetical protein
MQVVGACAKMLATLRPMALQVENEKVEVFATELGRLQNTQKSAASMTRV